ncbi:MAG: hypothetical protein NTW52_00625, partial [Planctomycetota bacterium]|nr:hypothetical protein [Planctomycetota bacterium]
QRCLSLVLLIAVSSIIGCSSGEIDQALAGRVAQYADDAKVSLASRDYDAVIELTNKCLESGLLQQQLLADVVALRVKAFLGKGELDQARDEISLFESVAAEPISVHALKYLYWKKKGDISSAERELSQARSIDPSFNP